MTEPFFFTWTAQREARPVEIVGGSGARVEFANGEHYLDLASLSYQANLGHGHPRMRSAIESQAARLLLTTPSAVYPEKRALAQALLDLAPDGYSKVFFTLGGAEANENALKIARMTTGRYKTLSRYRSYHGASMGALSLSGDYRRPPLEPGLPGVVRALDCYESRLPGGMRSLQGGGSPEALERTLQLEGEGSVGAVFLEPVPGANGVLVPPEGYWKEVRDICTRQGALLVADEVLCGFGRLGHWFGHQAWGVVPDMITVSKGLTGGYAPLGAVLVHERVARYFDDETLYAGLTYYGHPLGVAAALEAIGVYRDEGLIDRAAQLSPTVMRWMAELQDDYPDRVVATRGMGLLAGLDLSLSAKQFEALRAALDRRRVLVHLKVSIGCLILAPPLCIKEAELEAGLRAVRVCLEDVWRQG